MTHGLQIPGRVRELFVIAGDETGAEGGREVL
jgi:hypothetical protein